MENKDISEKIKKTFEDNLFSLGLKYQYHWASRRWRTSPNDKYLQPIWNDFQQRTLNNVLKIKSVSFFNTPGKIGLAMLENYPQNTPKKKTRYEYYKKQPEVIFYLNLIHYLFMMKSYKLHKLPELKNTYLKGKQILSKVNLEDIFLNTEIISTNPSAVANTIYYLKYIEVAYLDRKLISLYKQHWLSFTPHNEVDWHNKVYALTHLIIAATYFYQKKVEVKEFAWVLEFFEENIEDIIKYTNCDISSEVGLCFKLCGVKAHSVIDRVITHLLDRFDSESGFIPREDGNNILEKLEHRNVVATLLLSNWRKLHEGPNLYAYLFENKKSLFVPERGNFIGKDSVED